MFYEYKGNTYLRSGDVKIKTEKGWVDGVLYLDEENYFARTKEDSL